MVGPFKMKGSPMQRNFGVGSPMHKTIDPPATQSDSLNAVHILQGFDRQSNSDKKKAKTLIKNTKDNIKKTGDITNLDHQAKKVLQRGDYKTEASTKQIKDLNLPTTKGGSLSTRIKKKRSKNLMNKAVKGTEENTYGVLASQKKK